MGKGFIHGDALELGKCEHLGEEVQGQGTALGKDVAPGHRGAARKAANETHDVRVFNTAQILVRGCAQNADDELYLLLAGIAAEERLAAKKFPKDAAHAPHVSGCSIRGGLAQDLWGAIPARDNVGGQVFGRVLVNAASQAEIAHRQVTVAVDQQVGRLQVPVRREDNSFKRLPGSTDKWSSKQRWGEQEAGQNVCESIHLTARHLPVNDVGRMDELEASQHLVDKVLEMLIRQRLCASDDLVEIAFIELCDNIKGIKVFCLWWPRHNVDDLDNVVVPSQVSQELDLAQDALRIDEVGKHLGDALDRNLASGDLRA